MELHISGLQAKYLGGANVSQKDTQNTDHYTRILWGILQ